MQATTVGLVSPGDMGHRVGAVLREHGVRVTTSLVGRSGRTRGLAQAAGITDVGDYDALVATADVVLSILVPAEAIDTARAVAAAMRRAGATPLYVDANAISPASAALIGGVVGDVGGEAVDAAIIGPPPREPGTTRFYASGPAAERFAVLPGLDIRVLGPRIGQASALKMAYASITKGFTALATAAFVTAHGHGLDGALADELELSQPELAALAGALVPRMTPKARRWVGEMEEIAATYGEAGLPSRLFEGVADVYRLVGESALGEETPETRDPDRTLHDVAAELAAALPEGSRAERGLSAGRPPARRG